MDAKELGKMIKKRRKELKLSMQSVADNVGISQAYLSKIESGERKGVSYIIMGKIMQSLELDNTGDLIEVNLYKELEDTDKYNLDHKLETLNNLIRMYKKRGDVGITETIKLLNILEDIIKSN